MKTKPHNWKDTYKQTMTEARWMAIFEAIDQISVRAKKKNIPFDEVEIKPLDVFKFMRSTEDIYFRNILKAEHNVDLKYEEIPPIPSDMEFVS